MERAMYWEKLQNRLVKCNLCPHHCTIAEGKTGICKVRKNIDGTLYSMNSSLISSIALDSIEKKPLYHFYPGSKILSIGSIGCNLNCPFCQNINISKDFENVQTFKMDPDYIINKAISLKSEGNIGIAFTYNEPTVWYEAVLELAKRCKQNDLKTVMVTNGFISKEPLENLLPYIDAWNIDLKAFNENFYLKIVKGNLKNVLETITIASKSAHVELTTLIIPGENDSEDEMREEAKFIANIDPVIPLHISRFFPQYKMTDKPPTPVRTLERLKKIASEYLEHVYLGNV